VADYSTSIDIEAPPDIVYAHLVTVDGWLAWMGQHAEIRAEPGGQFAVDVDGSAVRGEYLEVEPFHRVVVSWGIAGSDDFPAGSSRVEFILTPRGEGTRVDLIHTDLPDSRESGYVRGWTRFLSDLRTVVRVQR
jgi:uncharacterized protein YndB with AHSA1/START domain